MSFDFDDTLTEPEWDDVDGLWVSTMRPREPVLELAREHAEEAEVRIVTTRSQDRFVRQFVEAHELPFTGIHFTNGQLKADTLEEIGSELHFDDSMRELSAAEDRGIETRLVAHPWDKVHSPDKVDRFQNVPL